MKRKKLILRFIIITLVCSFLITFFYGCGAIAGLVAAIFSSKAGFVLVPLLSDDGTPLNASQSGAVPGMIVVNQSDNDFPGVNYGPVSGATVTITGTTVTATTDENGYFIINEVPEGVQTLTVEKNEVVNSKDLTAQAALFVPIQMEVPVSTVTTDNINQFFVTPTNLQLISSRSYQLNSYGKTTEGSISEPAGVRWQIMSIEEYSNGVFTAIPNNGNVIDGNGVFTGKVSGTKPIRVTVWAIINSYVSVSEILVTPGAGSLSGQVTDGDGNPVSGAVVKVASTPYFTRTDGSGNYSFPEVPANYIINVTATLNDNSGSEVTSVTAGGSGTTDITIGGVSTGFTYVSTIGTTGVSGGGNELFNQPETIAFDSGGSFYVADVENHRVQKFSSNNTYLATIGSGIPGSGNDSFDEPHGVAVDGSGNLYVADYNNHRVQKFDSSGNYVMTIGDTGNPGFDNSRFHFPVDVAVDSTGNIYVTDSVNRRVQKFDSSGNYLLTIGVTGEGGDDNNHFSEVSGPDYIAVDSNNNVYVSDPNPNSRVQIFNSSGTYIATMGETGVAGTDNDHFNQPADIAFNSAGNIFVVDHFNHRVQMFDASRNYVDTIGITGNPGTENNQFDRPNGVAVSSVGRVYVGDSFNHRVQIFTR